MNLIAQPAPAAPYRLTLARGRPIELVPRRPLLMGVVNITPDSFSDGGRFLAPEQAIEHALQLVAEGADLLDLGAESTRPRGATYGAGASAVAEEEELERLLPVVTGLRRQSDVTISIDTRKAAVARATLDAGADLLNDVSGLDDPATAAVAATAGCPVVLMHHRGIFTQAVRGGGTSELEEGAVEEVLAGLSALLERALAAGCRREQIVLDPGLGFGKHGRQNLELLHRLDALRVLDRPLLVGASRKSFLGEVSRRAGAEISPSQRLPESLAAAAWAAAGGASILRVHDVAATRRFLGAWQAIAESSQTTEVGRSREAAGVRP